MRTAFIRRLIEEARRDPRIMLVVGDLGFSVVEPFASEFPERFINAGVAEQNMTGLAAGLAMEGFTVFTYSIGNFPTLRAMEQIRYDVCYHSANVKIIAVGGGWSYGPLGASHHATEELGMLRTIPSLTVCAPGDPHETGALTAMAAAMDGPWYIRLGKAGEPDVHADPPALRHGAMIEVLRGTGTAVLATGGMVKPALDMIRREHPEWGLFSVPFLKPMDAESLLRIAGMYAHVITLEEHQRSGGLGSAVLESLNDLREAGRLAAMPPLRRMAIADEFIAVAGSQEYLRRRAGLSSFDTSQ